MPSLKVLSATTFLTAVIALGVGIAVLLSQQATLASNAQEAHFTLGKSLHSSMGEVMTNEIQRMLFQTKQNKVLLAERAREVSNLDWGTDYALRAFNRTLFDAWLPRFLFQGEVMGFGANFLYPTGGSPTHVQSIQCYADWQFDNSLETVHAWSQTSAPYEMQAYKAHFHPSSNRIQLGGMLYQTQYFEAAVLGMNQQSVFDFLPWQSGDGRPWFFLQHSSHYVLQGVDVVVQVYASSVEWEVMMNDRVAGQGEYVMIDSKDRLVATSYKPEKDRIKACTDTTPRDQASKCIDVKISNSSVPLFQSLFSDIINVDSDRLKNTNRTKSQLWTVDGTKYSVVSGRVVSAPGESFKIIWWAPAPAAPSIGGLAAAVTLLSVATVVTLVFAVTVITGVAGPLTALAQQLDTLKTDQPAPSSFYAEVNALSNTVEKLRGNQQEEMGSHRTATNTYRVEHPMLDR